MSGKPSKAGDRMRVLVWASTLQADLLALTLALDMDSECELLIVCEQLASYRSEPIAEARPIRSAMLAAADRGTRAAVARFEPHLLVVDNHLPSFEAAPSVFMMWHGAGWKNRSTANLANLDRKVRRQTGRGIHEPNPSFGALCYGEPDYRWRIEQWRIDAGSCCLVGMPFADLILAPPYDRHTLQSRYRIDILNRPTVLVNITWHYGGRELATLEGLLEHIEKLGANALLCLHDRHRYEPHVLKAIHSAAARHSHVEVKHRSDHPDNLADLMVADVMLSNLSSFVAYFYVTGRPSIHLCPPRHERDRVDYVRLGAFKRLVRDRWGDSPRWMREPEENGGLTVYNLTDACRAIESALASPDCCRDRSAAWLDRFVHRLDGMTAERLTRQLRAFVG